MPLPETSDPPGHPAAFPETRWTLLEALRAGGRLREQALENICRHYWFPLYTWLRRSGHPHEDAEDLVQTFLSRLTAGGALDGLEREGGRLRSWLLRLLKNQAISAWRKENTQRRGGPQQSLEDAGLRYERLADPAAPPDAAFDRQWALSILETALSALRRHHTAAGREEHFTALQPALLQTGAHVNYAAIAAGLGISEGQARVTAFRMRKHLRQLIEAEILRLSGSADGAQEELAVFRRALGG